MKGILVSLADDEGASYRVTIDAKGQETSRERLRYAGGQNRIAPPPDPNAAGRGGGGPPAGRGGRGALPANLPISPPLPGIRSGEWNTAEILLDANIGFNPRNRLRRAETTPVAACQIAPTRRGEVGLGHAQGSGLKARPAETPRFRMRGSSHYYACHRAAAAANHDGVLDDDQPHYYSARTTYREIYACTINRRTSTNDYKVTYADQRRWLADVLTTSHRSMARKQWRKSQ